MERDQLITTLREFFERSGAHLAPASHPARDYGVDLVLTRIEGVHRHLNLGLRISEPGEDLEVLERFAEASRRGVVLKSLYIELPQEALETGGALVAYGACLALLFDKEQRQEKALGVQVRTDCSYARFTLDERLDERRREEHRNERRIGEELRGRIVAYFPDKGFGFIQTSQEHKYFFHIANIVEDDLRNQLPDYMPGEIIEVLFQYGGHDGKKYPKALNIASIDEDH